MSGKKKYIEKTLAKKAKTLQDLDSGMSMRVCVTKYYVFVGTIVNWKKNKSEIISFIYEFTSLSQKRPARVNDNGKVIDEEFTNGSPMLVVETFPFLAQFCKPKLYKWRPALV
jgi:hypothetical protein